MPDRALQARRVLREGPLTLFYLGGASVVIYTQTPVAHIGHGLCVAFQRNLARAQPETYSPVERTQMTRTNRSVRNLAMAAAAAWWPISMVHAAPVPVGPNDFEVSCELLDPGTLQTKTHAAPGEPVLLRAALKVGENVFSKQVSIVASARVKLFGMAIESRIGNLQLVIPDASERDQLQQQYGNGEAVPYEYGQEIDQPFTVPENFPPSTAAITLTAHIADTGEKNCSKWLVINE